MTAELFSLMLMALSVDIVASGSWLFFFMALPGICRIPGV